VQVARDGHALVHGARHREEMLDDVGGAHHVARIRDAVLGHDVALDGGGLVVAVPLVKVL